jgi:hypothetical protein
VHQRTLPTQRTAKSRRPVWVDAVPGRHARHGVLSNSGSCQRWEDTWDPVWPPLLSLHRALFGIRQPFESSANQAASTGSVESRAPRWCCSTASNGQDRIDPRDPGIRPARKVGASSLRLGRSFRDHKHRRQSRPGPRWPKRMRTRSNNEPKHLESCDGNSRLCGGLDTERCGRW